MATSAARREELLSQLFLTVGELAELMPFCAKTIRKKIWSGEIPATKYGRKWLVPVAWVTEQAARKM